MGREGAKLNHIQQAKNPSAIERVVEEQEKNESSWDENKEKDPELIKLAENIIKYGEAGEIARKEVSGLIEKYGSIEATPRDVFYKLEEQSDFSRYLLKLVFLAYEERLENKTE